MKSVYALTTVAIVASLVATFWLWPRHRIPEAHRWILTAESADLFEMDAVSDGPREGEEPVGEYSKKPFLSGDGLPVHEEWRAVAGPSRMDREVFASFSKALALFDAESDESLEFDCAFEPRTCLRFTRGAETLDVFVCVYCRSVALVDGSGRQIVHGDMHKSYRYFVLAVAQVLPEDERVQNALNRVRSGRT